MEKKVAIVVGKNFEEIEMVSVVDIVRRAGISLTIVSFFNEEIVTGAHNLKIVSELNFSDLKAEDYDGLIIPGGPGIDHLETPLIEQDAVIELVKTFASQEKLVAAICAAPQVLGKAGIVNDKNITHYPGSDQYLDQSKIDLSKTSIIDGNIITGRSPGTAVAFALSIVEGLAGSEKRNEIEKQLVI